MWFSRFKIILEAPKVAILRLIRFYQKYLSFDHGIMKDAFPDGFCKYYPSCSEYGYQSIEKHGAIKGTGKAVWRVLRCNPWSKGGPDPVK